MTESNDKVQDDIKEEVTETESPKKEEKESNSREFRADRYKPAAITWFVCAVLLVPCLISAKIVSMGLIIPLLIILGIGFMKEAKGNCVKISSEGIKVDSFASFKSSSEFIPADEIESVQVEASVEEEEEVIHLITLKGKNSSVVFPDVDGKTELLTYLKKVLPKTRIQKTMEMTEEQKADSRKLALFSSVFGLIGAVLVAIPAYRNLPEGLSPEKSLLFQALLPHLIKGALIGAMLGFLVWLVTTNKSEKNKEVS